MSSGARRPSNVQPLPLRTGFPRRGLAQLPTYIARGAGVSRQAAAAQQAAEGGAVRPSVRQVIPLCSLACMSVQHPNQNWHVSLEPRYEPNAAFYYELMSITRRGPALLHNPASPTRSYDLANPARYAAPLQACLESSMHLASHRTCSASSHRCDILS